jgi:nanoRNase/pAp phosphatase (c-di-AMP/oligoRNAs hydrolase)
MATEGYWKYGLALGAGVALGAVGAMLLSRGNIDLKKTCARLLSHGMDLKDKAAGMMDTARENMDDLAAEARHEQDQRKSREQES